jgi:Tfp pilus assembly protein PilO
MPKKETKILVIALILINALLVGAFIFLYNFTKNLIAESVSMSDDIKAELKKDEIRVLMRSDLTQGKIYQDELASYMLPSDSAVDFIKTVDQLVASSSLKSNISNVASEPYTKGNAINAELLKMNITVVGNWKNIQFFIKLLENYPLKIGINQLSLNKISDTVINGIQIPQWSGNIEFTVVKIKDTK